jgi:hypothetical protein
VNEAEIRRDILLALSLGTPLSVAARAHGLAARTVNHWGSEDPEFGEDLAGARSLGWDALAHECLAIADDSRNDYVEALRDDGTPMGYRFDAENVNRSRLRIETRLRLLRQWDSGRYGEQPKSVKVEATVTEVRRHVVDPRLLDDAQRAALRSLLEAAVSQGLVEVDDEGEVRPAGQGSDLGAVLADGVGSARRAPSLGQIGEDRRGGFGGLVDDEDG